MTIINKDQVQKLSQLARIKLTEAEENDLATKLSNIVSWVDKLNEVNTEGVEPMFAVFEELRLREDEVTEIDQKEELLKNACDREYNFFAVPKVISDSE